MRDAALRLHAQAANVSKERLASFDRPIVSEPKFGHAQCAGLKRDLTAYLQTLKVSPCCACACACLTLTSDGG